MKNQILLRGISGSSTIGLKMPLHKAAVLTLCLLFPMWLLSGQCTHFLSQLDGTSGTPLHTDTWTGPCDGQFPSPLSAVEQATPAHGVCSPEFTHRGQDSKYGLVIGGDFTVPANGGSEYGGKMAVKGNFSSLKTSGNYGISQSGGGSFVVGADAATGGAALLVGGNVNIALGSSVEMGFNNPAADYSVQIGGTLTGSIVHGGTASVSATTGVSGITDDIDNILDDMASISTEMANQTATGSTDFSTHWNARFTGTNASLEIFNVTAAEINDPNNRFIEFVNIAADATIVINVSGTTVTPTYTALAGRAEDTHLFTHDTPSFETDTSVVIYNLVWNFYQATQLNLPTSLDLIGTSLAPLAHVDMQGADMYGRMYVGGNFTHSSDNGDLYNYPFKGDLSGFCTSSLPVELGRLEAQHIQAENSVLVEWATYSEIQNKHFIVQYSTDGRNFQGIGVVAGQGNSTAYTEYKYRHRLANVHCNSLFYRLKQVDEDGSYEYSPIISMDISCPYHLVVYPTVIKGSEALQLSSDIPIPYRFMDVAGRVMYSGIVESGSEIPTESLRPGIYFVWTPFKTHRVLKK